MRIWRTHHLGNTACVGAPQLAIGRPVAELAEELCVSANLLYSWKSSPRALRREIALLRQENEISKKAAVILGTKTQPNYGR